MLSITTVRSYFSQGKPLRGNPFNLNHFKIKGMSALCKNKPAFWENRACFSKTRHRYSHDAEAHANRGTRWPKPRPSVTTVESSGLSKPSSLSSQSFLISAFHIQPTSPYCSVHPEQQHTCSDVSI